MGQQTDPKLHYTVLLGLLTALGPFTIDLYVPAFPAVRNSFGISHGLVQLTLAGTTLGLAVGTLLVGTWSDHVGRRLPLLLATCLHILASMGCALTTDISVFVALRFLQGIGAAASGVVVYAIVRDQFENNRLVVVLSRVGFVTTAAPLIAPVLGVELMLLMDWRGIFWILAVFALILLILTWFWIPETHPATSRMRQGEPIGNRLRALVGDSVFIGATFVGGMVFAAVYVYVAASPLIFQSFYDFSPRQFSLAFMLTTLALALGIRLNGLLASRFSPQALLLAALIAMTLSSLVLVVVASSTTHPAGVFIALWLMMGATGVAFPNARALSLYKHQKRAGMASSLYGAFAFTVSGLLSPVAGLLGDVTPATIGIVLLVVSASGMFGAFLLTAIRTKVDATPPVSTTG